MQIKNFLTLLGCSLLTSFVLAKDECQDIKKHLLNNKYVTSLECENNSNGEVVSMDIVNRFLNEEKFDPVCEAYSKTITKLEFYVRESIYSDSLKDLPLSISKLVNLEELIIDNSSNYGNPVIPDNFFKTLKSLKKISLNGYYLSQSNINEIGTLKNLEQLDLIRCKVGEDVDLTPLYNLKKLNSLVISTDQAFLNQDWIQNFKNIKELQLIAMETNPEVLRKIGALTNLEKLYILCNSESGELDFNTLKNLKNLTELTYSYIGELYGDSRQFPQFLTTLTKLKILALENYGLEEFPDVSKLTNLEVLDLRFNKIKGEIPLYLNSFTKLREVDFYGNLELKGKGIVNSNLKTCNYQKSEVCIVNETDCGYLTVPQCSTTRGSCGKYIGHCPSGTCCSKLGYCGTSEGHCLISQGCQSEFGDCINDGNYNNVHYSTNGECGPVDGVCPNGSCCSQFGFCGSTDAHCMISRGCQSEFGHCTNN